MTKQTATINQLSEFLADAVMTSHYLSEPPSNYSGHLRDAEMKCLKIISTLGPIQIQALATALHTTKARASQLVTILEQSGFAQKGQGTDLRVKFVSITELGEGVVTEARLKYYRLAQAIEDRLGAKGVQTLCELLAEVTPLTSLLESNEAKNKALAKTREPTDQPQAYRIT